MRKEPLATGNIYHVYNRGVNYGDIYFTHANRIFFLRRLREYCPAEMGVVIAYCLMPNHYHLIIQVAADDFGLKMMQPLMVSYTKAINHQEARVGAVFQGPFRARRVTTDGDLVNLSRYVHLNPVTAGFVGCPEDWEFSSYRDYIGLRAGTLPQPEAVLRHFASPAAYADFVGRPADPRAGLTKSLLIDEP
jgi:REP element-mobilizing transposase RayT